jgi:YfiH family protein
MITNKRNIAISILTADCAPILIIEKKQKFVGAIHAGWKGAFKGIVKKTIQLLKKNGCSEKDMIACIGPCIKKNSYEVKNDFFKLFKDKNKKNVNFFTFKRKKIYFDLSEYIKSQFYENGVKKIDIIRKDTYTLKNNFFSSRRSKKNKHNDYGRNISAIMIK